MKFTALFIIASALAVSSSLAAPQQEVALVERETPTCFIDSNILGGSCNWKCEQRGFSSGHCKDGTCTCSNKGKRDNAEPESAIDFARRSQPLQKRLSCQVGEIGGKGLSNALCSASCYDATGGKKDGHCNSKDVCVCNN